MNSDSLSHRPSDRVDSDRAAATELAGLSPNRAPGSTTLRHSPALAPERRERRTSARRLAYVERDLTERDRAIVTDIDRFGFLTTRQIERLHFSLVPESTVPARSTYRAIKRLADWGVIEHIDRRIGGVRAGSASFVWRLAPVGVRIVAQSNEARARRKEPALRFLDHRLAVADVAIDLTEAARVGRFELVEFSTEPTTWRPYLSAGGVREVLKPDGFAITALGDFEDYWFLEIDRSTESLPTIIKQCTQYARYRRTGDAQQAYGVFPLVVWVVPDEVRRTAIERAIAASDLDSSAFRVVTMSDVADLVAGGAA